jgi:hypothetical protein
MTESLSTRRCAEAGRIDEHKHTIIQGNHWLHEKGKLRAREPRRRELH